MQNKELKIIERQFLHPLVAKWLKDNRYIYKHEVKMPEYGRADFVACDSKGQIIIVECKSELGRDVGRDMAQVLDYCRQYGHGAIPALAAVNSCISDHIREICNYYNAMLIAIDDEGELAFQRQYAQLKKKHFMGYRDFQGMCSMRKADSDRFSMKAFLRQYYKTLGTTYAFIKDGLYLWIQHCPFEIAFQAIVTELSSGLWKDFSLKLIELFVKDYISMPLSIEHVWQQRGIWKQNDSLQLLDKVHQLAIGQTVDYSKSSDTDNKSYPLDGLSSADRNLIQFTKFVAALLHNHRESFGKPELSEDIEDVRPIIDAARPEIQRVFSQKPRRLPGAARPQLPER